MKCAAVGRDTYYNQGNLWKTSFRRRALALPTVPWNGQEFEVLRSQTITLLKAGGFIYPPQKHLSSLLQGDDSAWQWQGKLSMLGLTLNNRLKKILRDNRTSVAPPHHT